MIVYSVQGRNTPAHPDTPKGDPDKPRGGGRDKGRDGGRHQKPAHQKPTPAKPAHRKPAAHKPAHHKPVAHKKTAGRGELDAVVWFDVEFKPLAKGGHLQ